jgi:hypothetical protein
MAEQPPTVSDVVLSTLRSFLEGAPPSVLLEVRGEVTVHPSRSFAGVYYELELPPVFLYCRSRKCDDDCFFDPQQRTLVLGALSSPGEKLIFLTYTCRHCLETRRIFALVIVGSLNKDGTAKIKAMKFGEFPPAIGPAPRALQDLLGDQWPLYIQGRRAELAGLGIGAFVYYRRAVERIWQNVLDRLLEVARLENAQERIRALIESKSQSTLTRSMEAAKGAIPFSLYVDGHNPFQALYDACGDGVHEFTDKECIARARIIRLVLSRFSERAKAVLTEDSELRAAVGALASRTGQGAAS